MKGKRKRKKEKEEEDVQHQNNNLGQWDGGIAGQRSNGTSGEERSGCAKSRPLHPLDSSSHSALQHHSNSPRFTLQSRNMQPRSPPSRKRVLGPKPSPLPATDQGPWSKVHGPLNPIVMINKRDGSAIHLSILRRAHCHHRHNSLEVQYICARRTLGAERP